MATTAHRDPNRIPNQLGVSSADGITQLEPQVEATDKGWLVNLKNTLVTKNYDYVSVSYDSATQETYTFKSGGSGGTTVATIVIVYTDSTKANISTVTKT